MTNPSADQPKRCKARIDLTRSANYVTTCGRPVPCPDHRSDNPAHLPPSREEGERPTHCVNCGALSDLCATIPRPFACCIRCTHASPDLRPILTELLRLYDWRKELAAKEKRLAYLQARGGGYSSNVTETNKLALEVESLLRQYGIEEDGVLEAARAAL